MVYKGATTYGTHVEDYKESYPYLLQEHLRGIFPHVEVVNAGMSGYTTWESLANLQWRFLELEPDLLIVYHAINDVNSRMVWPSHFYKADNSGFRMAASIPAMSVPPSLTNSM